MRFTFTSKDHNPGPIVRGIRIFLFSLIIIGICLLISQKIWVPPLVDLLLKRDPNYAVVPMQVPSVASPSVATSTPPMEATSVTKTAILANGCFWCVEHDLEKVAGVIDVVSGYAGGTSESPTYENYAKSGHREVVHVTYDASRVSFANLVEHIIKHGDPTDTEGSFRDRGIEYAPAIYYETEEEHMEARSVINAITALGVLPKTVTLPVLTRVQFWPAEEYHQDYSIKNPLKYSYYRNASGRNDFIQKYWDMRADIFEVGHTKLRATSSPEISSNTTLQHSWNDFVKPSEAALRSLLTTLQYEVTQEDGTEKPFANEYDKNTEEGVYVDIVSGEPLFLSKDKYDSGTGWPSFVKPISPDVVTLIEDDGLFVTRTEVRSRIADSHLGHVFDDGPPDRGGKRYCMNSAALRFIPRSSMEQEGYAYLLAQMDT